MRSGYTYIALREREEDKSNDRTSFKFKLARTNFIRGNGGWFWLARFHALESQEWKIKQSDFREIRSNYAN